ncbi:MAG: hypothetical protein K940chlam3_01711 [Chlamydiae bacterium]|nr:hypothetical protein [Chlamydiota bacterium]
MKLLCFLYFFCCSCLYAFEHDLTVSQIGHMNEQELSDLSGAMIKLRGFLYETEDGRLIASAEPDLKSCCVGTERKIRNQVVIVGAVSPSNHTLPVVVQGVFQFEPKIHEGKLIQYASLLNAEIVEEESNHEILFILLIVSIVVGLLLFKRRKQCPR